MTNIDDNKAGSTAVDLEELAQEMPAETRRIFEERQAIHAVATFARRMRLNKGLTQQQLAEAIGATQPHISELERGAGPNGPTIGLLHRIAVACGDTLVVTSQKQLFDQTEVLPKVALALDAPVSKQELMDAMVSIAPGDLSHEEASYRRIFEDVSRLVGEVRAVRARVHSPSEHVSPHKVTLPEEVIVVVPERIIDQAG